MLSYGGDASVWDLEVMLARCFVAGVDWQRRRKKVEIEDERRWALTNISFMESWNFPWGPSLVNVRLHLKGFSSQHVRS